MRKQYATIFAWLAVFASPLLAQQFQRGIMLEADGKPLDAQKLGHMVPTVVDWNGDGKKDLIVGLFTGEPGNVVLYTNIGTSAKPVFGKGSFMMANGQPIKLTGG